MRREEGEEICFSKVEADNCFTHTTTNNHQQPPSNNNNRINNNNNIKKKKKKNSTNSINIDNINFITKREE